MITNQVARHLGRKRTSSERANAAAYEALHEAPMRKLGRELAFVRHREQMLAYAVRSGDETEAQKLAQQVLGR